MLHCGLPTITDSDNPLPEKIMGYISVQGKESVFGSKRKGLHKTARAYHAEAKDRASVRKTLEQSSFAIVAESALGMSALAAPGQFEELTGGKIQPREKLMHTTNG